MKKAKVLLSCIISALVISSISAVPVFATTESNSVISYQDDGLEPIEYGSLTSSPTYQLLQETDLSSYSTKNLETESYHFKGEILENETNKNSIYTAKTFTGKRSYYLKMFHTNQSEADIFYEVIDMSSHNEVKKQGIIKQGEVLEINVSGFSLTSKMYVKFTGMSDQIPGFGDQFIEVEGYIL